MATLRTEITIDRTADDVWAVVRDAGSISAWFPAIEASSAADGSRHCELAGGASIDEEIVTRDDALRRFQYRIVGGSMPVEHHLGTVDVFERDGGAFVVYGTDVRPDEAAGMLGPAIEDGLRGLKEHCESRS